MKFWLDARLSPTFASWLTTRFKTECSAVRDLNLRDADDKLIFANAHKENAVVITKDRDFVDLLVQQGPPPQVVWLTCGNTSNARLKEIFEKSFASTLTLLEKSEALVEISD